MTKKETEQFQSIFDILTKHQKAIEHLQTTAVVTQSIMKKFIEELKKATKK